MAAFDKISVLIVDDEPLIQNLVRTVLSNLGFTNVTTANNGRKAQALLSETTFDIIITDWRMNDIDGIDVVNFVRRSKKTPLCRTPILMLTGNTEDQYVLAAIDAGVNAYLLKPFTASELARRLRKIIEEPRDFVISEKFMGPDRRHANLAPPDGTERRRKNKTKAK